MTTVKILERCWQPPMLQPPLSHYFLGTLFLSVLLQFRLRSEQSVFPGSKPAFPSVHLHMQLRSDPWLQELGLVSTVVAYTDK